MLALSELRQASRRAVGRGPARERCLEVVEAFVEGRGAGFGEEGVGFREALAGAAPAGDLPPLARCFRHVGAGIARAWGRRAPWPEAPWGWLEADGLGFAEGLLRSGRALRHPADSPHLGWSDHGFGRSLWFTGAGSPSVARLLDAVDPARRVPIWAGLGLASAFTGGAPTDRLEALGGRTFAEGAAFGAALRAAVEGGSRRPPVPTLGGFHAPLGRLLRDDGARGEEESP